MRGRRRIHHRRGRHHPTRHFPSDSFNHVRQHSSEHSRVFWICRSPESPTCTSLVDAASSSRARRVEHHAQDVLVIILVGCRAWRRLNLDFLLKRYASSSSESPIGSHRERAPSSSYGEGLRLEAQNGNKVQKTDPICSLWFFSRMTTNPRGESGPSSSSGHEMSKKTRYAVQN